MQKCTGGRCKAMTGGGGGGGGFRDLRIFGMDQRQSDDSNNVNKRESKSPTR